MNSFIDFSQYSDSEIIRMQKEKKKEYIVLIQSERIAKKLLNYYGESLYTTNYHYRLNSEYYLLNERVSKKKISYEDDSELAVKIPLSSIVCRLIDSKNIILKNNKEAQCKYSETVDELINNINNMDISIIYRNGQLYFLDNNLEKLIDEETFNEYFTPKKNKQLTKKDTD